MSHPLIQRLIDELRYAEVSLDNQDEFVARPGMNVLFFPGDPTVAKDATDVAVVLPELVAAFAGRLRPGVVTDTWVSMGDDPGDQRHSALEPYRVDERLMAAAKPDAIFMHCLPAHREEEMTAGVIDGPQSVVWDEAENRLHAQKAILLWCLE